MVVKKVVVGNLEENCYFIIKDNSCIIVDPGDEFHKIDEIIKKLSLNVVAVLVTHAHFDHIGALEEVLNKYNIPLFYNNINKEISYENLISVNESKYELDKFKFEVIYTPGHRNDLVTYYFYEDNIMFTGDFLFRNSIGRTDLEYSNFNDMIFSLNKIYKYNDEIIIYPGHGRETTLDYEKKNNYYMGVYCEK